MSSENAEAAVDAADPLVARLERALRRFRLQSAHNLLDEALATRSPPVFLSEVAEPVLARLESEPVAHGVATSMLEQRLLAQARGWEAGRGPLVVLACAPREERVLALVALGIELAERGCRISYLGAATPVSALRDAAREQRAALVVVSGAAADLTGPERGELRALAAERPLALIGRAAAALDAAGLARLAHAQSSPESDDASPGEAGA